MGIRKEGLEKNKELSGGAWR